MTKLLVVGPSWVGDMVMAQSLFRLLQNRFNGCEIDVLAPAWSHPLVRRMPEVRKAIEMPLGHGRFGLKTRWQLGRQLIAEQYDRAIVLPRSWKSAVVPLAAKIPIRTGFLGEMRYGLINDIRRLDKKQLDQTVKRYVALGLAPSASLEALAFEPPQLRVDPQNQRRVLQALGLNASQPAVALMPGAEYGPAKQWPVEHFQELARGLLGQGFQAWVIGSAKERALGDAVISSLSGAVHNLCGRTSLEDAVDLLAFATHAVSNDSGLMHVAAAVGTQVHAIYGSSSPVFTPPLTDRRVIHYQALSCSPCFKRTCPLGHYNCLRGISAEQVLHRLHAFDMQPK